MAKRRKKKHETEYMCVDCQVPAIQDNQQYCTECGGEIKECCEDCFNPVAECDCED